MANPRSPVAKAKVTGAAAKNPQRHRDRKNPKADDLGAPSTFLNEHGLRAWEAFRRELPWLKESDRSLLEVVCTIRGRLLAGDDVGIQALSLLQSCLTKLGATPADRSKVSVPDGEEEEEDEFFGSA